MKNEINLIVRSFSFITARPDSDWIRVFSMLFILATISLCWNIYFFFSVRNDIQNIGKDYVSAPAKTSGGAEQEMMDIIQKYEARAEKNAAIIQGPSSTVADPAGA